MFALVRFSDAAIWARAERNGVHVMAADGYYVSGPSPNEFVLGFSAIGERAITAAVKRLVR